MRAMLLKAIGSLPANPSPLERGDWPDPITGAGEVLIRVGACGVCHTELDEIEGRMPPPRLPIILGHQVVGRVEALGEGADGLGLALGRRVGVAWIFRACGHCVYCRRGEEDVCDQQRATRREAHGGYAGPVR